MSQQEFHIFNKDDNLKLRVPAPFCHINTCIQLNIRLFDDAD